MKENKTRPIYDVSFHGPSSDFLKGLIGAWWIVTLLIFIVLSVLQIVDRFW